MQNEFRKTFDSIHAEAELLEKTRSELEKQRQGAGRRQNRSFWRTAIAAACFLLFVSGIGGYAAYFTPVAAVYADGSGYAQLTVNRFSRVIAVAGDMGENTLKNMDCEQALRSLARQEAIDALTVVAVSGKAETAQALSQQLSESGICRRENCQTVDEQTAQQAQALGLTPGKYRMYLALQEAGVSLTPEQAQSCSMRQLRRMLPEADFPNTQMQEEACTGQGEKHTWAHGKNQKNQSEQPMA